MLFVQFCEHYILHYMHVTEDKCSSCEVIFLIYTKF